MARRCPKTERNPLNYIEMAIGIWGASQVVLVVKNLPANAGDIRDMGLIPGSWRSPRGGHGNPHQCSCLENPRDRGACKSLVHRVAKSQTWLKRLSTHTHTGPCSTYCQCQSPRLNTVCTWIRILMILQIPKDLNHVFPTKYLQLPSTQGKREHLTILLGSPRLPGTYTETPGVCCLHLPSAHRHPSLPWIFAWIPLSRGLPSPLPWRPLSVFSEPGSSASTLVTVQFSLSVTSDSLWPPWMAACQASLSITKSWSLLKLMSVWAQTILCGGAILCIAGCSAAPPPPTSTATHTQLWQPKLCRLCWLSPCSKATLTENSCTKWLACTQPSLKKGQKDEPILRGWRSSSKEAFLLCPSENDLQH